MKKLLEKPWAKALAFLLTLLPGTAAVYGGVELVYIYVYNMHTDRRLDMLWAVTAVCAVVAAASLVFSLSAAGHWPGHEGIHLTWVEKIPVDLFVLGLTCVWYIYLDAVYYPSATLGLAVFVARRTCSCWRLQPGARPGPCSATCWRCGCCGFSAGGLCGPGGTCGGCFWACLWRGKRRRCCWPLWRRTC